MKLRPGLRIRAAGAAVARRCPAAAAALALAAALIVYPTGQVRADCGSGPLNPSLLPDTKDPYGPVAPGTGLPGYFYAGPKSPPRTADPFAAGATTTLYEQYGIAGLQWGYYDLGCAGTLQHPDAAVDTYLGTQLMVWGETVLVFTDQLNQAISPPTFLKVLDPMVLQGTTAIFQGAFLTWAGLSIALLGVWLITKAARGEFAMVLNAAGWALVVLTVVGTVLLYPLQAGHTADQALTDTIGRMNAGFTGKDIGAAARAHTALIVDTVVYREWLRGEFGSADSAAAKSYGPRLFKAQALTWGENTAKGKDRQKLVDAKHDEFTKVASDVKDNDPDAYAHLTGKTANRAGTGLLALITLLILCGFQVWTCVYIIYALALVRGVVMLLPALAVAGLWLPGADIIRAVASLAGRALITAVLYSAANGLMAILARYTLGSDAMPLWLSLIIFVICSAALFLGVRQVRGGRGLISQPTRWLLGALVLWRLRRQLRGALH